MPGERKRRKPIIHFLKTAYRIGDKVPVSAIYECSECDKITAFRKGEVFLPCEEDHGLEEQDWYQTNQVIHFVTKNLNTEFSNLETVSLRLADLIAEWSGTMAFVYLHVLWFAFWVYVNTGHTLFGVTAFDPYPFGLLTMIVSLEAIFLSTFILLSQNRQTQKSELRAELDYQTNLKTEKDVAEILSILHDMREEEELIEKETSEVLDEAHIHFDKPTKRVYKGKFHKKKVDDIIKDAGIFVHQHKKKKQ